MENGPFIDGDLLNMVISHGYNSINPYTYVYIYIYVYIYTYTLWLFNIAMERSTIFKNGKPSISMGHLYHGYVK